VNFNGGAWQYIWEPPIRDKAVGPRSYQISVVLRYDVTAHIQEEPSQQSDEENYTKRSVNPIQGSNAMLSRRRA